MIVPLHLDSETALGATTRPHDQPDHRRDVVGSGGLASHQRSAHELLPQCAQDKRAQRKGQPGHPHPEPEREQSGRGSPSDTIDSARRTTGRSR